MKPECLPNWVSRIRLAAAIMAAACAVLAIGVASASAELADVAINEVESNGDEVHGDWIELYNNGEEVVDLSGVILSDNDNGHRFVIPASTSVGGEDWIAFEVDEAFGLGKEDSARMFAAGTENLGSAEPLDIYMWTAHAATTYGANPDGSDEFETTAAGTFEAENNFGLPEIGNIDGVKLNEVESNGDVSNGDWVELYNTTGSAIDIDGAIITDDNPAHQFVVPSSTPELAAGGYVAFQVDDKEVKGNFGLGSNDAAKLYAPNDITLSKVVDQHSWSSHAAVTYGRTVAGAGEWKPTSVSTFAAVNQFSGEAAPDLSKVVINEAESHGDDTNGDWIELKNTGEGSVNLDEAILSDDDNGHVFRIPTSTPVLPAGEVAAFRVDDPALGDGQFGLGDDDEARLFEADAVDLAKDTPVDMQEWTTHAVRTYGLNGEGKWVATNKGTFGAANDFVSEVTADLSDVVLNEVVTTGDTVHGDWVELLNTSGSTLAIGGMVIADCDENEFTIPAMNLAAGDTHVFNTEEGEFGLGKEDCARLYRNSSTSIPIDHHEWSEHAERSYARQMHGFGIWIEDETPTYDATNE